MSDVPTATGNPATASSTTKDATAATACLGDVSTTLFPGVDRAAATRFVFAAPLDLSWAQTFPVTVVFDPCDCCLCYSSAVSSATALSDPGGHDEPGAVLHSAALP